MFARNSDFARLASWSRPLTRVSSAAASRCSVCSRASSRVIRFICAASSPNSSRFGTVIVAAKSPPATVRRNACASRTGRMNDHEMT